MGLLRLQVNHILKSCAGAEQMVWYCTPYSTVAFRITKTIFKPTLERAGSLFHPLSGQPAELPLTSSISPVEQSALKEQVR